MKSFHTFALTVAAVLGLSSVVFAAPKKPLVIYFSWSGNTRTIAQMIQESTGADLFEVQVVNPYPSDYHATVDVAKKEKNANARPSLKMIKIPNLANYDMVLIGSPCWWGTLPMAMMALLEANDLSGKSVAEFMTHEGSGLGSSEDDVKKLCPKSKILEPIAIRGGRVRNAQSEVNAWLKKIGAVQ